MNKITLLLLALLGIAISYVIFANRYSLTAPNTFIGDDSAESAPSAQSVSPEPPITQVEETMKLTSSAFDDNGNIPSLYACDGDDISPPLTIQSTPDTTASFTLIVNDPDAPSGDWVHWVVWNINPTTTVIEEGSLPTGAVQGKNDFGDQAYGGPCPPDGTHHYLFNLYALDTDLDLPGTTTKTQLLEAMSDHIIQQSTLSGLYQRN